MKFKSHLLAQASGSVAGATYTRNKGGLIIRSRSLVITPKTPQQDAAQNAMKTLSARWKNLTEAQRAAWKTYAINTPLLNALGDSRVIPELAWYIRTNSAALQALGITAVIDDAPTTFGLAVLTTPTITATAPSTLSVAYDNTDEWATADGGLLLIQQGRPIPQTHKFPKTNYRECGTVDGNTMTPPTSPDTPTAQFTFAADDQILMRFVARTADGRTSSPQVVSTVAL